MNPKIAKEHDDSDREDGSDGEFDVNSDDGDKKGNKDSLMPSGSNDMMA
jgi:hypothetical protein